MDKSSTKAMEQNTEQPPPKEQDDALHEAEIPLQNNESDIDKKVELAYKKRLYKLAKRTGKVSKELEEEFRNIQFEDDGFLDEVITVNVINRRVLGKVIIRYCGHEGTEGTEQSNSLRKLLQTCIDNIRQYPEKVWANADITVYDIEDNTFRIISGHGKHTFIVSDNSGTPEFNQTSKNSAISNDQSKCVLM